MDCCGAVPRWERTGKGVDVRTWPILLQKDFWSWNEEQFSRTKTELGILIHRTGYSDSIVVEFPWPGRFAETFATISAHRRRFLITPSASAYWGTAAMTRPPSNRRRQIDPTRAGMTGGESARPRSCRAAGHLRFWASSLRHATSGCDVGPPLESPCRGSVLSLTFPKRGREGKWRGYLSMP
jgi:hypothetical protein